MISKLKLIDNFPELVFQIGKLLTIGLYYLKREDYHNDVFLNYMKTEKEIKLLKMELMAILKPADNSYYGLSLENLIANN